MTCTILLKSAIYVSCSLILFHNAMMKAAIAPANHPKVNVSIEMIPAHFAIDLHGILFNNTAMGLICAFTQALMLMFLHQFRRALISAFTQAPIFHRHNDIVIATVGG